MMIQGRNTTTEDIELVRNLIADNPDWNRTRLSQELCVLWDWRNHTGQLKDMACRTFLLKLERRGYLILPAKRGQNGSIGPVPEVAHQTAAIAGSLNNISPISVEPVSRPNLGLFKHLLCKYHYLGFSGTVGQNMKYMVFDKNANPLACLLFGSAAWKCAPRDEYIGWSHQARQANINLITNNMRFLILPWVKVPHLASHLLGQVKRRIIQDWLKKYGHPVYMLETFVEKQRFAGTCYKAANWVCVGQTKGRSRNDRNGKLKVPIKDIYLAALTKNFQEVLCYGI